MPKATVGFCGLGAMGLGMATHLVKQGFKVKGFDISPVGLSAFRKAGGTPTAALADSAQDTPFYILMVANEPQAQKALFDKDDSIVEALPDGAVLCMCCTVRAAYVKSVAQELSKRGRNDIKLVDCPVSGGAGRAASGDLTIMCGGKPDAVKKASLILEELTGDGGLFIVEGGLGQGSNMKMCHQVLAAVQILSVAEAFGFAAAMGLDAHEVQQRILGSEAWSWMFEHRSPRVLKQDYNPPVSAMTIITKDAGIVTSTARQTLFPTPLTSAAEQVYLACCSWGQGADDDAAIVRIYHNKPVTDVKCTLEPAEKERRMQLVIELLVAINIGAASEAIMLADHVEIPLPQFFDLCTRSAGNSRMFERFAKAMRNDEGAEPETGRTMQEMTEWLVKINDEALTHKAALGLANTALMLFEFLRRRVGGNVEASNLLRKWE